MMFLRDRSRRQGSALFWPLLGLVLFLTVGGLLHLHRSSQEGQGKRGISLAPSREADGRVALPPGWGEPQRKALRWISSQWGGEIATLVVFQASW
jgi:hypothetical protein